MTATIAPLTAVPGPELGASVPERMVAGGFSMVNIEATDRPDPWLQSALRIPLDLRGLYDQAYEGDPEGAISTLELAKRLSEARVGQAAGTIATVTSPLKLKLPAPGSKNGVRKAKAVLTAMVVPGQAQPQETREEAAASQSPQLWVGYKEYRTREERDAIIQEAHTITGYQPAKRGSAAATLLPLPGRVKPRWGQRREAFARIVETAAAPAGRVALSGEVVAASEDFHSTPDLGPNPYAAIFRGLGIEAVGAHMRLRAYQIRVLGRLGLDLGPKRAARLFGVPQHRDLWRSLHFLARDMPHDGDQQAFLHQSARHHLDTMRRYDGPLTEPVIDYAQAVMLGVGLLAQDRGVRNMARGRAERLALRSEMGTAFATMMHRPPRHEPLGELQAPAQPRPWRLSRNKALKEQWRQYDEAIQRRQALQNARTQEMLAYEQMHSSLTRESGLALVKRLQWYLGDHTPSVWNPKLAWELLIHPNSTNAYKLSGIVEDLGTVPPTALLDNYRKQRHDRIAETIAPPIAAVKWIAQGFVATARAIGHGGARLWKALNTERPVRPKKSRTR